MPASAPGFHAPGFHGAPSSPGVCSSPGSRPSYPSLQSQGSDFFPKAPFLLALQKEEELSWGALAAGLPSQPLACLWDSTISVHPPGGCLLSAW